MVKYCLFILIAVLSFSCSAPYVYTEPDLISDKVDFNDGKWLLNNIKAPGQVAIKLENYCHEELKKCLGNRLYGISDMRHKYFLPNTVNDTPKTSELKDIHSATGFNYLINIKPKQLTKNIGIDSSTGEPPLMSEIKITVNIYNLERGEIVYSHIVRGHINYGETPTGGLYSKAVDRIYYPILKRAVKDLKKKSNCK